MVGTHLQTLGDSNENHHREPSLVCGLCAHTRCVEFLFYTSSVRFKSIYCTTSRITPNCSCLLSCKLLGGLGQVHPPGPIYTLHLPYNVYMYICIPIKLKLYQRHIGNKGTLMTSSVSVNTDSALEVLLSSTFTPYDFSN